ncbi:DUF4280 domain-containing protein [Flavobacterium sp. F-65]|jgi:hypothetical protein|uniref:DUF4280 domain-containing protein n=1 Tax=Flavobacterium pisciphilum TaxID=2893755 RepID=A0ABS8MZU6_9FLAO|nr:DUF4280 domain-containing protein [Flavobacterium sp. F-65]MCC9074305.1 DUF4280 domain-containing protein [Flavobacterium sp. F-65]
MAKPDNTLKRKQREEKEDAEDGLKFVIDGAKLKCDLCTVPEGDLKVNYDTPSTQDKRTATIVEKDKKSVIFKGNCKKSPQSASPCASVMKLADWKDVGTVYFQDKFPLLLKSTIKCEYGGVPIKITDSAQRNVIEKIDTIGAPVLSPILDFDIKFTLDKTEKTVVPFGILDFKDKIENPFFRFKYKLEKSNIDDLHFEIIDESGDQLYAYNYLKPVIIQNKSKKTNKVSNIPMISAIKPIGSPDLEPNDYTVMGSYILSWDGFDNDEIYDSTRFNSKNLKAKITARKDGIVKSIVVDFSTKYSQIEWTDVKIDKKTKRIDVTLRVDLKDGGDEGFEKEKYRSEFDDPRIPMFRERYVWEKIPKSVLTKIGKPIIKQRTRSFKELEQLALKGLEEHWSRNHERTIGNNVSINSEQYEVFIKALNTINKSMDDIDLKYSTNLYWGRSNNSGDASTIKSVIANILEYIPYVPLNETIYYNAGYQDYNLKIQTELLRNDADWRYIDETFFYYGNNKNTPIEDKEFSFTSAHELGHSILKAIAEKSGGSTDHSYQHKGSSDYSDVLPISKGGKKYPKIGEIDLMKYYNNDPHRYDYDRVVATEDDVLGLIWLTKIEIK